ncbi:MAG: hypothetical protein ABJD07_10980 [Gemmatimonadaceae bacterium]
MKRVLFFAGLVALAACASPEPRAIATRVDTLSTVGRASSPDDTVMIAERDTVPLLTTTIAMGSIGDARLVKPVAGATVVPATATDSARKCAARAPKRAGTPS